jgi:hypothetical protein
MAGVKAKKDNGGQKLATRWKGGACFTCAQPINGLKDAWRVRHITFNPTRRTRMVWEHRACLTK